MPIQIPISANVALFVWADLCCQKHTLVELANQAVLFLQPESDQVIETRQAVGYEFW